MPRSRVPEIPDGLEWFNVDSPVSLSNQAGRVLLLDFGNYSSMQCQQVLSDLQYLAGKYRDRLVILSIHTPCFPREKDVAHVQKAINRHQLNHPVVHDRGKIVSKAYGIRQWPTQVLVDREGIYSWRSVRGGQFVKTGADHRLPVEQAGKHPCSRCRCRFCDPVARTV